ncbi:putative sporulation protein YtxC [Paenibacillus sp. 1001270B_150601_E10]|uniref:putative sporulation protein YtxC n=1 Tax=Paenibacillus sp. 1001270B_150601_E10 TaxID=2787079 RepID=UPI00189E7C2C|nr:putative sporulation protein YtxC [Paenibacillus sp. 1001270B_150601_E10]
MELFTITIPNQSDPQIPSLIALLELELGDLHKHPCGVTLETFEASSVSGVTCVGQLPGFQLSLHGQEVWNRASRALAEYILVTKEEPLIRALLDKERYLDPQERGKIEDYCLQLLNGHEELQSTESRQRRKTKLSRALNKYLEEHTSLHLEGFIRFRLDNYLSELREVVDYAVDEYVLERQYQEFIGLLKYFVFIQDTKIPLAHLLHKGGHEFFLLNEKWEPLEPSHVVEGMIVEMIDCDMEMEDMIVSTLINVSPGHIVIHTREKDSQVIKTIQQIFDTRVQVCDFCSSCESYLSPGWKPQDQVIDVQH